MPDGQSYDRSSNSQLVQFLDDGWNVPAASRTPDFANRPWWTVINNAYAQYSRVSGITLTYIAEQTAEGVSTGAFGDIRIGGEVFPNDGPGGALADNVYPDGGDMRIDTTREANGTVGSYFSTEPGLRNLVIHETGHGVGLGHAQFVNDSAHAIMEGGLRTDIWGLQFDDVYALNRQYGDPNERNGGNDSAATATQLGSFTTGFVVSRGASATDSVVQRFDRDWLGIDGSNDQDWFRFTVAGRALADITLTPLGPTYETVQQGVFNAAAQSDLVLQFFSGSPSGLTALATINQHGLGQAEQLSGFQLPGAGDYYIRIRGTQDLNQFYRLDLAVSAPETTSPADFDASGQVDAADLAIWQSGFGASGPSGAGDATGDGVIDGADFLQWQREFTPAAAGEYAAAAVSEPAGHLLLAMGLSAVALRRQQQSKRGNEA
ncbi:MAG: matrixin family metalloprotease [Pirellulales bacterium]|nr:matrixin family metalloprotease [Pirellulales bacterium]